MTILSVVKDVCATVGVLVPNSVFSNITGNRTMQEMLALANEMAQRIASDTRDWTKLKTQYTFTGDAVADPSGQFWTGTTAFSMPQNYRRLPVNSNVWRSTQTQSPMRFFSNTDEWLQRRISNNAGDSRGEWTLFGGQMHILPVLRGPVTDPVTLAVTPAETATFVYISRNAVALASGGFGDSFMADGDQFVLDERLLKLGMIWQWRAHKGSPYAEDMGTYADALMNEMGFDSPSPVIMGRTRASNGGWDANTR